MRARDLIRESEMKITRVSGNKAYAGDGVEIDLDKVDIEQDKTTNTTSIKPKSPINKARTQLRPGQKVSMANEDYTDPKKRKWVIHGRFRAEPLACEFPRDLDPLAKLLVVTAGGFPTEGYADQFDWSCQGSSKNTVYKYTIIDNWGQYPRVPNIVEDEDGPVERPIGMGDSRTASEIKSQILGLSDSTLIMWAHKRSGMFSSKIAKMQNKLVANEMEKRGLDHPVNGDDNALLHKLVSAGTCKVVVVATTRGKADPGVYTISNVDANGGYNPTATIEDERVQLSNIVLSILPK